MHIFLQSGRPPTMARNSGVHTSIVLTPTTASSCTLPNLGLHPTPAQALNIVCQCMFPILLSKASKLSVGEDSDDEESGAADESSEDEPGMSSRDEVSSLCTLSSHEAKLVSQAFGQQMGFLSRVTVYCTVDFGCL